jgi:hypothetical protein
MVRLSPILGLGQNLQIGRDMQPAHQRTLQWDDVIHLIPNARLLRQAGRFVVDRFHGGQVCPTGQCLLFSGDALKSNSGHRARVSEHPGPFRFRDGLLMLGAIVHEVLALLGVVGSGFGANVRSLSSPFGSRARTYQRSALISIGLLTRTFLLQMGLAVRSFFRVPRVSMAGARGAFAGPAPVAGAIGGGIQVSAFSVFRCVGLFLCQRTYATATSEAKPSLSGRTSVATECIVGFFHQAKGATFREMTRSHLLFVTP